jgi:predicted RNA binding protein YcfA (HicA-like mRNA interferase family)/predicted RNase H-like HicB family nuclease
MQHRRKSWRVPPKVREIVAELEQAGFVERSGKGSHRNFVHPKVAKRRCEVLSNPRRETRDWGVKIMKESARYAKIVEWSEEDQCYIGSSPGLVYGGCHGADEKAVFEELCQVVEEVIAIYHKDGKPLPPPTSGRDFANKMQNVA